MSRRTDQRLVRRPLTAAAAVLTGAHHGFELSNGIGLVLQPELGLAGSSALWGAQLPAWILLAARGGKRWDRVLAVWCGTALAGALVHFIIWPWRRGRLGIPVLIEAEGLDPSSLPVYNAILYVWGAASALAILLEIPGSSRKWALAGLATLPLQHVSATHHFTWLQRQAVDRPAWWNRAVTPSAD